MTEPLKIGTVARQSVATSTALHAGTTEAQDEKVATQLEKAHGWGQREYRGRVEEGHGRGVEHTLTKDSPEQALRVGRRKFV